MKGAKKAAETVGAAVDATKKVDEAAMTDEEKAAAKAKEELAKKAAEAEKK